MNNRVLRATLGALCAVVPLSACSGGGGGGGGASSPPLPAIDGCAAPPATLGADPADDVVFLGAHNPDRVELLSVSVSGNIAVLCDALEGLRIYDVCNSGQPIELAKLPRVKCTDAEIYGDFLYATSKARGATGETPIFIIDISDPSNPQEVSEYTALGIPYEGLHLDASSGQLFAAAHGAGAQAFEIRDDGRLRFVSDFYNDPQDRNAIDMVSRGSKLFVADGRYGLQVFDISDVAAPRRTGVLSPREGTELTAARSVALKGDYAFIALSGDGFGVIDISGDEPTWKTHVATPKPAFSVAAQGNFLYVAAWEGLRIYDISSPASPKLIATEATAADFPRVVAVDVSDDRIYVAEWKSFQIFRHFTGRRNPDIRLSSRTLVPFPQTEAGDVSAAGFVLANDGTETLDVARLSIEGEAPFALDRDRFSVAPGGEEFVELTFSPTNDAPQEATLRIESNDPDESLLTLSLKGNDPGVALGAKAPNFSLPDVNGVPHSLSDYEGQVVVLVFFGVT